MIKGPEQTKFEKWWKIEKKKGLIDFKITLGNISKDTAPEDIYGELNEVNRLLALPNGEGTVERLDVF